MSLIDTAIRLRTKHTEIEKKLAKYELSIEQLVTLCVASRLGSPGTVTSEFDVYPSRATAVIDNLENRGLLTREIAKVDRRKITLRLTVSGEALMRLLQNEAA